MYSPVSDFVLFVKAAIIRTPLEPLALRLKWLAGAPQRWRTPELEQIHLEDTRMRCVVSKLLRHDSCCVDVGCHIGSFLSVVIKLAPIGTHIAIEPTPRKCVWLKFKFPEVEILQVAASDTSGSALFIEDRNRSGYSHLSSGANGYRVRTLTLDEILAGRDKIDLIKIDTESHELEVLRGCVRTAQRLTPAIMFECATEYHSPDSGVRRKALFDLMVGEMGYDIFTFEGFLLGREPLSFDKFRECGIYPFQAFSYVALPKS